MDQAVNEEYQSIDLKVKYAGQSLRIGLFSPGPQKPLEEYLVESVTYRDASGQEIFILQYDDKGLNIALDEYGDDDEIIFRGGKEIAEKLILEAKEMITDLAIRLKE
jgi:hypothetical protein